MQSMILESVRYRGDTDLLRAICEDDALCQGMEQAEVLRKRSMMRLRLLGQAVRVDVNMMPKLAASFARLAAVAGDGVPLEAYVFADAEINAFVFAGDHRRIIGVSSAAVAQLGVEELEFVIGHELGHAILGHLDVVAEALLAITSPTVQQAMLLRAWQRASEISADRVGLVCCGSLEVAASAIFKTVCGLALEDMKISATELAAQWEPLAREVLAVGSRDQWQLSHPFPPMRVKALTLFAGLADQAAADSEIARLLAYMDPQGAGSRAAHNPLLAHFLYWGGMYLATSQGGPRPEQRAYLERVAGLVERPGVDTTKLGPADCLRRFREARETRKVKLSSRELHQIAAGLIDLAAADGDDPAACVTELQELGRVIGFHQRAIDLFLEQHRQKGQPS